MSVEPAHGIPRSAARHYSRLSTTSPRHPVQQLFTPAIPFIHFLLVLASASDLTELSDIPVHSAQAWTRLLTAVRCDVAVVETEAEESRVREKNWSEECTCRSMAVSIGP
ncbi:hypothetical protein J6590_016490 [Homalodisca vitripennis]|nr:hypothetical protein J6590_016490 [Homalodisca vitripennis]